MATSCWIPEQVLHNSPCKVKRACVVYCAFLCPNDVGEEGVTPGVAGSFLSEANWLWVSLLASLSSSVMLWDPLWSALWKPCLGPCLPSTLVFLPFFPNNIKSRDRNVLSYMRFWEKNGEKFMSLRVDTCLPKYIFHCLHSSFIVYIPQGWQQTSYSWKSTDDKGVQAWELFFL